MKILGATTQSPRSYDLLNLQSNQLITRLNAATNLLLTGQLDYPRTAIEIAAAVVPPLRSVPNGPLRYGAVGDGATDDQAAFAKMVKCRGYHTLPGDSFLLKSGITTSDVLTLEGVDRNYAKIVSNGVGGPLVTIGNNVLRPNPNAGLLSRLHFFGAATDTAILKFVSGSDLWALRDIIFSNSPCPAIVLTDCFDHRWDSIEILACFGSGSDPSTGASIILNGASKIRALYARIDQSLCGSIYLTNFSDLTILEGKCDYGFIANQLANVITLADNLSEINLGQVYIGGLNSVSAVHTLGGFRFSPGTVFDGGTNATHIIDRRAWFRDDAAPTAGGSFRPRIAVGNLGGAQFNRTHPSSTNPSIAVLNSKTTVRALDNFTVTANGSTSGNGITIGTNISIASNGLYVGCFVVHNVDGHAQRRKILQSFTNGNLFIQGTATVTVDADWSIEFCGGHYTQIQGVEECNIDAALPLFEVLDSGITLTITGYTASSSANGGGTEVALTTNLAASFDATGFYLVDEETGMPFLIYHGLDASKNAWIHYDERANLDATHTYRIEAGHYAGIRRVGSVYEWSFAGKRRTRLVSDAAILGYDQFNLPLWGGGASGGPVNIPYSASITPDVALIGGATGGGGIITATNNTAFTLQNPVGMTTGDMVEITLNNTSGGALGAITLGSMYKLQGGAFPSPATGNRRTVGMRFDGTHMYEIYRTAADVAD